MVCAAALLALGIFVLPRMMSREQNMEQRPTAAVPSQTTGIPTTGESEPSLSQPPQPVTPAPPATQPQVPMLSYEEYLNMTPQEQQDHYLTFPSITEYMAWLDAAKQAYEDSLDRIEIEGDGNLDIGDIIEGMD